MPRSGSVPTVVDTHVHFWDLSRFPYPWLESEDTAALSSDYLPSNFMADSADLDVSSIVHVQADIDHSLDPVEETAWLASLVDSAPDGFPPMVVVAYADLRSPTLADTLARHAEYDFVRGIRQEVWFDPESTLPGVLRENLLDDPAWTSGLRRLADYNLSFDLLVKAEQLQGAAAIFREIPEVPVIVDHAGVPTLTDGAPPAEWRDGMRRFASEVPNSVLKISGMGFIKSSWEIHDIAPIVRECIEIFGPSRCAFGSNFPVEKPDATYSRLWEAYAEITRDLSTEERTYLFSKTAELAYRIPSKG
jgi:predicted TIM-barrel fold metal-dependent hydrolase